MLFLIKGRAGSGKTKLVNETINKTLDNSKSDVILVVPEQFSFESERKMLKYLGGEKFNKIKIFSFPRMAFSVLKDECDFSNIPSPGVRLTLMYDAIKGLEDNLKIFNKSRLSVNSLKPLVDFSRELKSCLIKSDDLISKVNLLPDGYLKDKIKEIDLINQGYDALIKQSYFDETESVDALSEYAANNRYFSGKSVFIDGFRSFSKQEASVFSVMLSQAENVYVTLCTDSVVKKESSFSFIRDFETRLRGLAAKNSVAVYEILCEQSVDAFPGGISNLEKSIFNKGYTDSVSDDGSVKIIECSDSDTECDFIAREIKKIINSGEYRCRDIAVIERVAGTYKNRIIERLHKLDIPVFDDSRRLLRYEALFVYLNSVLLCITSGFNNETVFSYLKSGLSGLSFFEISELEKYALIWKINGNGWTEDFIMHPDGFGNEFKETDYEKVQKLNKLRKKAIAPLLELKKNCKDKSGKEISEAIYNFLKEQKISDKLYNLYSALNEGGFGVEANRQSVSWDILMNVLDSMANLYPERIISLSDWTERFKVFVESGDVGEIPQGLDEVKIGSADRIRTDKLKVVFLVGVNKDEFPLVSVNNNLISDADRACLSAVGLELSLPFEARYDEERFISYCAVTAASERLYLVYKNINDDGSVASPSEIVATAQKYIENIEADHYEESNIVDMIASDEDAFSVLSKYYNSSSSVKSTLIEYFSGNEFYSDKIKALDRIIGKEDYKFNDIDVSRRLFGEDMQLSASRIESYYSCPFSYFARYGLSANPLNVSDFDSRQNGLLIHYILENMLSKYSAKELVDAEPSVLKKDVSELLEKYLEEKMGGMANKSKRFMFLFNRVLDTCMMILNRLRSEFAVGSFEPHDFELKIGGDKVPAYKLDLKEGSISVTGYIDRVDLMEKGQDRYIRIVDYKTGKKEFKLVDLLNGINIQMVLYLMALEKNGKDYLGDFYPAGVLYLPSKTGYDKYSKSRFLSPQDVAENIVISGKLSGMVLKSPVVYKGMMGENLESKSFPISVGKGDSLNGNNYTLPEFRNLSKVIDNKIVEMGEALHKGLIPARPIGNDNKSEKCTYCPYKLICGFESGDKINEAIKGKHSDALKMLGGDDSGD